jgi:hypothetical protein
MPCPDFDALQEKLFRAARVQDQTYDPSTARRLTDKKLGELRDQNTGIVRSLDHQLNSHVRGCAACQTDGRQPDSDLAESHHR